MSDRRLTLQQWMGVVVGWALMFAWIAAQGSVSFALAVLANSPFAWGFWFALAIGVGWLFGRHIVRRGRARWIVGLALGLALYLGWAQPRSDDPEMRGLPFPDYPLFWRHLYHDARRPVAAGNLKLHGEYPRVRFEVGLLKLGFTGQAGVLIGVLAIRPKEREGLSPEIVQAK